MKKLRVFLLGLIAGISLLNAQSSTSSYTQTLRFLNSDMLQIYQGARIAAPTMTLPSSTTTYTSTLKFTNSDNLQIYNAVRGIGQAVSSGTSTGWQLSGNSVSTNTAFIGTIDNRSFLFKTNNTEKLKIDSLGRMFFNSTVLNSGASTTYSINMPKNTGQTSGTEIHGIRVVGNGRQWSTTVPGTQREYYFSVGTYSATAPTSFVNTFGAYFDSPNLGTNVSVTGRNYAAGFNNAIYVAAGTSFFGGIVTIDRASQAAATALSVNGGSASVNAFQISASGTNSNVILNSRNSYSLSFQLNDIEKMGLNSSGLNVNSTATIGGVLNTAGLNSTGDINITSSGTNKRIFITGTAAQTGYFGTDGSGFYMGSNSSTPVRILVGNGAFTPFHATTTGNVGINTGTPDASAVLDVNSTTKGFLPPRMTDLQLAAIASPATGLTVYCTNCTANDATAGVMVTYNGSTWKNHW